MSEIQMQQFIRPKKNIIVIGAENHIGHYDLDRFKSDQDRLFIFAGSDSIQQPQTRRILQSPGLKIDFNGTMSQHTKQRLKRLVGNRPTDVIFDRSTMKYVQDIAQFSKWISDIVHVLSDQLQVLLIPVCLSGDGRSLLNIVGISRNRDDEFYGRYSLDTDERQMARNRGRRVQKPSQVYLYQDGIHVPTNYGGKMGISLYLDARLDQDAKTFLRPFIQKFNQQNIQNNFKITQLKQYIKRGSIKIPDGFSMHFHRSSNYGQLISQRYGLDIFEECPLTLEIKRTSQKQTI